MHPWQIPLILRICPTVLILNFTSVGYELSRRAGKLGTPERPLSDLGLRSYVAFWIAVLIRFFRTITPPDKDEQAHLGSRTTADTSIDAQETRPSIAEAEGDPRSSTVTARNQHPVPSSGARPSSTMGNGGPPDGVRLGE
jgi:hypothetical protein